MKNSRFSSVGVQMFRTVMTVYMVVAMAATLLLIYEEYKASQEGVWRELKLFKGAFDQTLAQNLWTFDLERLKSDANSMLEFPLISGVIISDHKDRLLFSRFKDEKTRPKRESKGTGNNSFKNLKGRSLRFPVYFSDTNAGNSKKDDEVIGYATLFTTEGAAFTRITWRVLFIILTAIVKFAALWIIFLHVSRRMLTKPLVRLNNSLTELDIERPATVKLDLQVSGNNELTRLEETFNQVGKRLYDTHRERERTGQLEREKEKAEAATRAKSEFLANMSHEIRTPMNAVMGMAHLALKTELTSKQQDYLNKIQSSANSLLGIINDILDFSKIEAGKLDMEAVEFDLAKTLDNVANVITVKAQEKKNVEVLFHLDSEVPNFLIGDSLRLNQILVNLGNNAVKFTDQGEIVLTTKMIETSDGKVTLQFSMRDTGIGMTEQQQNKLFQAFSQADTSTTRKYGGTGLGLTISKRLVNMMGGDIWVESEAGKGTTFSFTASFGLGKKTGKKRLVPSRDLKGLKVLVADDSATSRGILQNILESFSFEVYLAPSGEEALEEIEWADQNQPFKLVLMDWKMTGMDGLETARRIKRHKALKKKPAIVIVSAYGREDIMRQADEIGLEGFLHKPVSPSMLFDTIMQALGKEVEDPSGISRKIEKTVEGIQSIAGARVLLVEDNDINQQVAQEILQGAGLNVTVANDGQEGVEAAMQHPYDVILMDIQMPVMDGYAATRRIRKWELGLQNENGKYSELKSEIQGVPIIAMTAHAMAGDDQKSIDAGMNDHVTKPINPDLLFATLQKWIKPVAERAAVAKSLPALGGPPAIDTPPEPDQAVPEEDGLPDSLQGFDLAAGLSRLMGNKRLYRKLLLDFGASYGGVAGEISEALAVNDFVRAHSLVHNLKGLAGNLEATDLQAAAVEMEKLVKGQSEKTVSEKDLKEKFAELNYALEQALDAAHTLGPTVEKKTIESSRDVGESVPPELIKKATGTIKTAVEMGDVMKIISIAKELKSESDAVAPFCDRLIRLADDLDFDSIQKLMLELEN